MYCCCTESQGLLHVVVGGLLYIILGYLQCLELTCNVAALNRGRNAPMLVLCFDEFSGISPSKLFFFRTIHKTVCGWYYIL